MPVPAYVAFLRAINLGPTRKFPKAAIVEAVEDCGFTDVETYINTGNVRFRCSLRSRAKVEQTLERSFKKHAGFDVPTIVFTTAELKQVAARTPSRSRSATPTPAPTTSRCSRRSRAPRP